MMNCPNRWLFSKIWGILHTRMDTNKNMNFEYFQIQKWMLQTLRAANRVIYLVSMFSLWVMVLKLYKKVYFCNFVLISAKNLSLLKQFTCMDLVMHQRSCYTLQNIELLIMLRRTVLKIWRFEVKEFCTISAVSASFLIFQSLPSWKN